LITHIESSRARAYVQTLPTAGSIRERDEAAAAALELTLAVAGPLRSFAPIRRRQ
jgi:hypothetical protein